MSNQTDGNRFYITLTPEDQERVRACLDGGHFESAGDLIREGISVTHARTQKFTRMNEELRVGMTSIGSRLERYQK